MMHGMAASIIGSRTPRKTLERMAAMRNVLRRMTIALAMLACAALLPARADAGEGGDVLGE